MDEEAFRSLVRGQTRGIGASVARAGLRILSWPYAAATGIRNLAFDLGWGKTWRAPVPVVSVGNLTVGGAGKTPTVEYVADRLRERGLRVAILSRGYGAQDGPNDEALVLEENLPDVPHLQGKDRVALAQIALEELDTQVLVLDDGFQHRRLCRELDMALLDATDPFGGGRQLPAGLLRESPRGLRRADLVLITRCDAVAPGALTAIRQRVHRLAGEAPILESRFAPRYLLQHDCPDVPLDAIRAKPVIAFAGIGNPGAFWKTVSALGADLTDRRVFSDHHAYSRDDLAMLERWSAQGNPAAVLTTQKDLVKLRVSELSGVPLYAVRIALTVDHGAEHLDRALEALPS